MPDVLGPLALVVDFLAAVRAQVLLAVLAEDGLHLVRGLLALLADELHAALVAGVAGVALGAADLLALQAPECAVGLLVALLALDGHYGTRLPAS